MIEVETSKNLKTKYNVVLFVSETNGDIAKVIVRFSVNPNQTWGTWISSTCCHFIEKRVY